MIQFENNTWHILCKTSCQMVRIIVSKVVVDRTILKCNWNENCFSARKLMRF